MITVQIPPIMAGDSPKFTFKVYRVVNEYGEDPTTEISDLPFSLVGATLTVTGRSYVDAATVIFSKAATITAVAESGVLNECELQLLPTDFAEAGRLYMELEVRRDDINFVGTPIRLVGTVQQDIVR
jgi:hypothetical protein